MERQRGAYEAERKPDLVPYLLRWLADRKPDLVALQKIRVPDTEFPTRALGPAGYRATAYCRKGEYGVTYWAF